MMTIHSTKLPFRIGTLLIGLALVLVGCDSAGPSAEKSEDKASPVTYKVTNDLGSRVTHAGDNASTSGVQTSAAKSASFELLGQITPPNVDGNSNTTERASHVTYNGGKLYVGHMLRGDGPGNGFNGGTDIIDVSNPELPSGFGVGSSNRANALQVENVDVQESAVVGNTLFLGVAEEPSLPGEVGAQPGEVHSIRLSGGYPALSNGEVVFEDREVNANLIKAVTPASSGDNTNEFYAVTDANSLYRFDVNTANGVIDDVTTQTTTSSQFRGIASNKHGGFALSRNANNGNGYLWRAENSGGLSQADNFGPFDSFGSQEDAIARVTTGGPTCNGAKLVFVALNNSGFRVLKTSPGGVAEVFKNSTLEVTSLTATDDYVYAASGEEIAVFRINDSEICNTNGQGLSQIGKAPVENFVNGGLFSFDNGAQVNQVAAWNDGGTDYLAIAMGTNGVFVAKRGGGTYP